MAEVQRYNLQDNAASTLIDAAVGTDGALAGGNNTADLVTTGPGGTLTSALDLDGTADYIDSADITSAANAAITVAAWINLDAFGGSLCSSGGGGATDDFIQLGETAATIRVADGSATLAWNSSISTGAWTHFVFTRGASGAAWRAYVNGVEQTATRAGGATDWIIVKVGWTNSASVFLDGKIAGWVVRDDEANQTIVDALFAEGSAAAASPGLLLLGCGA